MTREPVELFTASVLHVGTGRFIDAYDVSPGGQRFLMKLDVPSTHPSSLVLVSNWTSDAKR